MMDSRSVVEASTSSSTTTTTGPITTTTGPITTITRSASEPPLATIVAAELSPTPASLTTLDVSRNSIAELPDGLGECLCALRTLDVSRNKLWSLPLGLPPTLVSLNALSNKLRPVERSLPAAALATLPALALLDLRFNPKIKGCDATSTAIKALLPAGAKDCSVLTTEPHKVDATPSAASRDATQIRCQLEPISTPQLRKRLARTFGIKTDPEASNRDDVLAQLVMCYEQRGARPATRVAGAPLGPVGRAALPELLEVLRATSFPVGDKRERPKVRAEGYIILNRPLAGHEDGGPQATEAHAGEEASRVIVRREAAKAGFLASQGTTKARLAIAKLKRHVRIWELAEAIMREADPAYADAFTAVAVTKQFQGSPHIDTENVAPFYGLGLGDYEGGFICVESSDGLGVYEVDTRARMGRVDGRYPHWVAPHTGERYSLIYYQTAGEWLPQGPSVFADEQALEEQRPRVAPRGAAAPTADEPE